MGTVVASLVTLLVIAVMLWFAVGTQRNISNGNALLTWLQGGLPMLGRRTTVRWLGSSAVQLRIEDAKPPFATVEVVVVLEPRDVGMLWAFARRRGRRDFVILRGTLRRAPTYEVEAAGEGWTARDRLDGLDQAAWRWTTWHDGAVTVAHSPSADLAAVRARWDALDAAGGGLWRLSVRLAEPHVEVHVLPPADRATAGGDRLVQAFVELGRTATGRG